MNEVLPVPKGGEQAWIERIRGRARKAIRMALLVIVVLFVLGIVRGLIKAKEYQQFATQKLAIALQYERMSGARQYAYGPHIGTPLHLAGYDTSIWIKPDQFAEEGRLRPFYMALVHLEDRWFESGLGVNVKGLGRAVWARGSAGGGSGIHDQTCDALKTGAERLRLPDWKPIQITRRVLDKIDSVFCGIGLARRNSPREVMALYATYGFLASGAYGIESFARIYWRFDGIDDPRLTRGHQLVLASMFNQPWDGTDRKWQLIRQRAYHALDLLIAAGVFDESNRKGIRKEIEQARPRSKQQLRRHGASLVLPHFPREMAYPVFLAAREAKREFGEDWRAEVRTLELTIDGKRQSRAHHATAAAIERIGQPGVRGTVAVVDDWGEYAVVHTGGPWFDNIDRMHAMRSPGSIGKLIAAAALARAYGTADVAERQPELKHVQDTFRYSEHEFADLVANLPLDQEYIARLIDCYGEEHSGIRDNPAFDAAMGAIAASPAQLLPILQDAYFGLRYAMHTPHVVRRYVTWQGEERRVLHYAEHHRLRCAALIHNEGQTYSWFKLPMSGTMRGAKGFVEVGKTGTVGPSSGDSLNNLTLAIGGRPTGVRGGFETGIAVLGADSTVADGNEVLIPGLQQASRSTVVLLAELMGRRGR